MLLKQFGNVLRINYFDLFLIISLAIAVRIPAYFLEREPYLFCDESIYAGEAMRMLSENTWITEEFRAGGLNTYLILIALIFSRKIGLFPTHFDVIDLARAVETVALGSATSIFIYLSAIKIFEKRSAGIIAGLVFVLAPGSIAYSRYAYPDHYVYFFSSGVLFYLICFLKDPNRIRYIAAAGLFAGMAISVKYSAVFLSVPVLVAIVTGLRSIMRFDFWNFAKNLAVLCLSTMAAILVFNFSALLNPKEFLAGFFFNVENYSSSTGSFLSGISYYLVVAFVIYFGIPTLPLWIIGSLRILKEKQLFFGTLMVFPIVLVTYLGSLGLVLNRNMSIAIPFIIIPISGAILYIFSSDLVGKSALKIMVRVTFTVAIILSVAQASYGYVRDLRTDSRLVANQWIKNNLNGVETAGINEFCSGQSPAVDVIPQLINDSKMDQKLPVYVLNSYWDSPLAPFYRETKPFWQELEQKQIHFYHFGDRKVLKSGEHSKNLVEYVPSDYEIVQKISGTGPEIVILVRSDLLLGK
jgi:4-amino-4-deoxy-L-arabinose transferase-like glycosyltransferase